MFTAIIRLSCLFVLCLAFCGGSAAAPAAENQWRIGVPMVHYWAGPGYPGGAPLNDKAATQLKEGGWNVVWCTEKELDVVQRHGLRGMLNDPVLYPASFEDPQKREALAALVERVRKHPALYAYYITDEPSAGQFPALGRLVAFLRDRDPKHLAFINLFPTYANNQQLGTKGDTVEAYNEHLRQYVEVVRPGLISYDHYQFMNGGDNPQYFLNLKLIRDKSLDAGLPFLNIVQASCWVAPAAASPHTPRVPNGDEMTYLVYTTIAYGAQGISYYVYCYPDHQGGIAQPDGTPTPLYHALKKLHPEFVAIVSELQKLKPLGVYHLGMRPPGTQGPPEKYPFTFTPAIADMPYKAGERVQGVLISEFGKPGAGAEVTQLVVVNLDYKTELETTLHVPARAEVMNASTGQWGTPKSRSVPLRLGKGAGVLLRLSK